jgi:dipeptidyl aminopeptidase/acylaminoacyl peptidase
MMTKLARAVVLGAVAAVVLAAPALAAPHFQLGDLQQIVRLSEPAMSPDGKQVAVLVSKPDWSSNNAQVEIALVDVATGAQRALTWQRAGLSSPAWSVDGTRLAFLAEDGKDATAQVFVMPMSGGDARRITNAERGVDAFSWSPDGTRIAYTTPDEAPNAQAIKAHDDAFRVTDNHFLTRVALTPSHLWVVSSSGGAARRLSEGDFSLQTDQAPGIAPAWSADGRRIAFTRFPGPYWATSSRSVVATVGVDGGAPADAVAAPGATHALYAPGGGALAYQRVRGGDLSNGTAVYVQAPGQAHDATAALGRDIENYAWLDAGTLLLSGVTGTRAALWEQPVNGAPRRLDLGEVLPSQDLSVSSRGAIAFVGSTTQNPGELFVIDKPGSRPRRLTHLNAYTEGLALGASEPVEWQGPDGFHEDGVLTYPPDFKKGKKYPLVLFLHGGPQGSSVQGFFPLQQLLAAAGFLVFEPNYRGSNNLGDAYQHAVHRDTAEGPGKDVMAGLASLVKRGIVDESRIGVSGWSYGGFMTAWLTGHYPAVWKAAVAGAAMTDWTMDNALSHYQDADLYYFGSSPWSVEGRDIWRAQSPIASAHLVKAPTLILGDVGDPNVPLANSYAWFHALRQAGTKVEFYAYPIDTHLPRDIVRKTDVYRRWVGWMTEHLK